MGLGLGPGSPPRSFPPSPCSLREPLPPPRPRSGFLERRARGERFCNAPLAGGTGRGGGTPAPGHSASSSTPACGPPGAGHSPPPGCPMDPSRSLWAVVPRGPSVLRFPIAPSAAAAAPRARSRWGCGARVLPGVLPGCSPTASRGSTPPAVRVPDPSRLYASFCRIQRRAAAGFCPPRLGSGGSRRPRPRCLFPARSCGISSRGSDLCPCPAGPCGALCAPRLPRPRGRAGTALP